MKVLHLLNYLGNGGSEEYIRSIVEFLPQIDFRLLYSIEGSGIDNFKDLIPIEQFPMNSVIDYKAAANLKKYCKTHKIDIIHTHFMRENSIAVISKFLGNKVKIINTRHMLEDYSKKVQMFNRLITKGNEKIIAVSPKVKNRMISEGISKDKIEVVCPSVNPNALKYLSKEEILKEYPFLENKTVFMSISRFSIEKGYDFLIRVIKNLKEIRGNLKDLAFVFFGDGPILEDMKKLASDLSVEENTYFLGYKNSASRYMPIADVFVSASKQEAFGTSIAEAILSSKPIIVTNVSGIWDMLNSNGIDVATVDYGNVEKFAHALNETINNIDDVKAKANIIKEKSKAMIDPKENAEKLLCIYKKILEVD